MKALFILEPVPGTQFFKVLMFPLQHVLGFKPTTLAAAALTICIVHHHARPSVSLELSF
jgi:hypothetical protein